jgi:hypothetical protein
VSSLLPRVDESGLLERFPPEGEEKHMKEMIKLFISTSVHEFLSSLLPDNRGVEEGDEVWVWLGRMRSQIQTQLERLKTLHQQRFQNGGKSFIGTSSTPFGDFVETDAWNDYVKKFVNVPFGHLEEVEVQEEQWLEAGWRMIRSLATVRREGRGEVLTFFVQQLTFVLSSPCLRLSIKNSILSTLPTIVVREDVVLDEETQQEDEEDGEEEEEGEVQEGEQQEAQV